MFTWLWRAGRRNQGWPRPWVLDGNHLPASGKRLAPLRSLRGAALPERALVVHDPDSGAVTGRRAPERTRASRAALAKRPWSAVEWLPPYAHELNDINGPGATLSGTTWLITRLRTQLTSLAPSTPPSINSARNA